MSDLLINELKAQRNVALDTCAALNVRLHEVVEQASKIQQVATAQTERIFEFEKQVAEKDEQIVALKSTQLELEQMLAASEARVAELLKPKKKVGTRKE